MTTTRLVPVIAYVVHTVMDWDRDDVVVIDEPVSDGFLPLYYDYEEAEEKHPGCVIEQVSILLDDVH